MRTLNFESNGYEFSVISDERGVTLASCPSIKDFTIREVKKYKDALEDLYEFLKQNKK